MHISDSDSGTDVLNTPVPLMNVGHFGHGHFGLGRFGLDILATDISATKNSKGGRFDHNHKLWVECVHALMCDVFLRLFKYLNE